MDIAVRIFGHAIGFYKAFYLGPNIFTLLYCFLFVGVISQLERKIAKIVYLALFVLFYIFCITQFIYYSLTNFYFSFSLLQMAGEGSAYILDTIIHTPLGVYGILLAILIFFCFIYRVCFYKQQEVFRKQTNIKSIILVCLIFAVLHSVAPYSLGIANEELKWNSFRNARNVYNSYSDANKSMRVSGLYEYTVRNFYMTYLKPAAKMTDEQEAFLNECYGKREQKTNDYTGIFAGKNLIFLQLEGMDDWMLSEDTTPTLYKLMKKSMVFSDHYSMYTGGGSTFNSEFAVNTGFTTPISYNENVYTLNKNTFPDTMARLFKKENYLVNAFHMNTAEFYSRGINYKSWGYDAYYGLADLKEVDASDPYFELDRAMMENETFKEAMFPQNQPFVDYIITYTPHTPFTTKKGVGKKLASMLGMEESEYESYNEEEVAKMEATETDRMVSMLLAELKERNLMENTVLVVFADHYLYTLNDKSILDKYKITKDNRINHTPFFIWSENMEYQEISKTNMQLHILPTVLNLFGMEYNPNNYIGEDILDDSFEGISFFTDQTWWDGERYVSGTKITDGKTIDDATLKSKNQMVLNMIQKNDLTLKYDYFKE